MLPYRSTKEIVYRYIISNPGSYFREILRSLNIGTGNLQYALYTLEYEGKITTKKVGTFKHFYPTEFSANDQKSRNLLCILSQESPREILTFLVNNPGACQTDVARHIRCSSPTARWYLRKLELLSLIWCRKDGQELKYYANTSLEQLANLLKMYRPSIWQRCADRMADMMRTFENNSDER